MRQQSLHFLRQQQALTEIWFDESSINFTGDMPIALMPDGPSLGGFVCPATIITTEMWKMGQVNTFADHTFSGVLSTMSSNMLD